MIRQRISKDLRKRKSFYKYELQRQLVKSFCCDRNVPLSVREFIYTHNADYTKSTSSVQLKNRCVLTGRAKAVYRLFKLSRLMFRKLASNGMIPGIRKASW